MKELSVQQVITAFLAIGVRISGLMLFAPFFGSQSVPPRIKAGVVVAVSILLFPLLYPRLIHLDLSAWPIFVSGELLIGAALGIAMNLVFDAVQMAGQVVSTQMGFSLINILDPQTQVDSTVMSVFYQTIAMLIFLRLNVHIWLLRAVGRSFALLPPGSFHISGAFAWTVARAGGAVFSLGVQLAAPVLCATFLTDIVLGLLGKASPQAPLMLLGTPLKTMLAFSILFLSLKYWPAMFNQLFQRSIDLSDHLLALAR